MPSPVTLNSNSVLSRPQEDNAGASSERYQSPGSNSSSPAHRALALHASEYFSCPISSRLLFRAYNAKHNNKSTLETPLG